MPRPNPRSPRVRTTNNAAQPGGLASHLMSIMTDPSRRGPLVLAPPTHAESADHAARVPSDEALARLAQGGSKASFGTLIDRYEGRILGYLRRRVRPATDAEELAQETFVRAWVALPRFKPELSFSTWLFTIASRLAVDHYRQHQKKIAAMPSEMPAPAPRDHPERSETSRVWDTAQAILPPDQMTVLWLRYAAGLEIGQIAKALGRTGVGVRVLLFRARERLARHFNTDNNAMTLGGGPAAHRPGDR